MNKSTFRQIMELDSVGLMFLILVVVVYCFGMLGLGVSTRTSNLIFTTAWLVCAEWVYLTVMHGKDRNWTKIAGQPPTLRERLMVLFLGPYIGWQVWVWPRAIKMLFPPLVSDSLQKRK